MALTTDTGSPQTAYDIQRGQIQKDEDRKRAEAQKALKRRLASTGMSQSGGLAEVQSRRLERDLADTAQSRLATADVAQLQEQTAMSEAEKNRGLTREQLAQQGALTREQMAQTGALSREQMGLTASESAKGREQQSSMQRAQFEQDLNVLGQNLGLDREKLGVAVKQFSDQMAWDKEKTANDQSWKTQEALNDRVFQKDMANLNNTLQQGNLSFADQLAQAGEVRKADSEAAFNRGQSGVVLTADEIAKMSPMARSAYEAGKSGRTYDDYKREQDSAITLRNTLITQAAEEPAVYRRVMNNVAKAISLTGGTVPEEMKPYVAEPAGTSGTGTSTIPTVPEKFEDLAKLDPTSPAYKQYIDENNIKPITVTYRNRMGKNDEWTSAPSVGDTTLITINGKATPVKVTYRGHYNTPGTSDQAYIQFQAPDGSFYHMRGDTSVKLGKAANENNIKG